MKRTAFVPIGEDLSSRIQDQQYAVRERFTVRTVLLSFPGKASNPYGTRPYTASGHRSDFQRWLAELYVLDGAAQKVWITPPHQLRHGFA